MKLSENEVQLRMRMTNTFRQYLKITKCTTLSCTVSQL